MRLLHNEFTAEPLPTFFYATQTNDCALELFRSLAQPPGAGRLEVEGFLFTWNQMRKGRIKCMDPGLATTGAPDSDQRQQKLIKNVEDHDLDEKYVFSDNKPFRHHFDHAPSNTREVGC